MDVHKVLQAEGEVTGKADNLRGVQVAVEKLIGGIPGLHVEVANGEMALKKKINVTGEPMTYAGDELEVELFNDSFIGNDDQLLQFFEDYDEEGEEEEPEIDPELETFGDEDEADNCAPTARSFHGHTCGRSAKAKKPKLAHAGKFARTQRRTSLVNNQNQDESTDLEPPNKKHKKDKTDKKEKKDKKEGNAGA